MNPLTLSTGGGGLSGSSGVTDQSSTAATSGTGDKNFGMMGNPNFQQNILGNPLFLLGLAALAVYAFKK